MRLSVAKLQDTSMDPISHSTPPPQHPLHLLPLSQAVQGYRGFLKDLVGQAVLAPLKVHVVQWGPWDRSSQAPQAFQTCLSLRGILSPLQIQVHPETTKKQKSQCVLSALRGGQWEKLSPPLFTFCPAGPVGPGFPDGPWYEAKGSGICEFL